MDMDNCSPLGCKWVWSSNVAADLQCVTRALLIKHLLGTHCVARINETGQAQASHALPVQTGCAT
jgi:hypothetical protein